MPKNSLLNRVHAFLNDRFVKQPKRPQQIEHDWQFTKINGKINVYGEKRDPLGDMNRLAEITCPNPITIKVRYTANISTQDLNLLKEQLELWADMKSIIVEPMFKAYIEELVK